MADNAPNGAAARTAVLQYVEGLIPSLDERPQKALLRIRVAEHRVLAVRNYLRVSRGKLDKKWAWSDGEIAAFYASESYTVAQTAIESVKAAFRGLTNQECDLIVNAKVRPLAKQIDFWNGNVTVLHLGHQLIDKLKETIPLWWGDVGVFKNYMIGAGPQHQVKLEKMRIAGAGAKGKDLTIPRSPTHATPGLSDHGRASAFDFVVVRRGTQQIVAGTTSGTAKEAWDAPGWTAKLKQAVVQAGNKFDGPLIGPPYEPWHYVYRKAT